MTVRCLLVDDEFFARQLLEGYIRKVNFLELVGQCENAIDALELMQQEKIDLLFLDINLPEINGVDFLRTLKKNKPEIIITTAYSEHAMDGYQLDVIEYLLKPIFFDRFLQAVNKARDMIDMKRKAADAAPSQNAKAPVSPVVSGPSDNESYIFIKTGSQRINKIFLNNILYIESLNEYIRIHLEGESHTIHYSLKSLLEVLPADQFVQIHRSFIINFHKLDMVEGNHVRIHNTELNIGKNYREAFLGKVRDKSIGMGVQGRRGVSS